MQRIMGIDYGDARVGVAVSDPLGITAQGLETIKNTGGKALFCRLAELIDKYNPAAVVVGYPKNMNGTLGKRAKLTQDFADKLKKIYPGKIVLFDERLSTAEAVRSLNETNVRGKKRKNVVDTVAAVLILQTYLDKTR